MAKLKTVLFDCWDTVIHYNETDKNKGITLLLDVCDNPDNIKSDQLESDYHALMHEYYKKCNDFDLRFIALFRYICVSHNLKPRISYEEIEKLYNQHLVPTPVENLRPLLNFLKQNNIKVGVCSNTIHSEEHTVDFIKQCWPDMPFDFVMASSTYGVKKPNPRFFEIGAKLAGSKNEETIYIGDNFYADVYGSWLSGFMKSIWLNQKHKNKKDYYLYHPEMSDEIEYTEIDDYLKLIPILEKMI